MKRIILLVSLNRFLPVSFSPLKGLEVMGAIASKSFFLLLLDLLFLAYVLFTVFKENSILEVLWKQFPPFHSTVKKRGLVKQHIV